ncbi:MAG: GNAT family N-acetyltransferase [Armatimonadota bacterium]|nr:GNAT family N-acetyltransferase [bacterium]
MNDICIAMIRHDINNIPEYPLPAGFSFRAFAGGDETTWAELMVVPEMFQDADTAMKHFREEFLECISDNKDRCFFIVHEATGRSVATAMAWYDCLDGEDYGRVHWVVVHPEFQGAGLGKALLSRVMQRLAESHSKAYLRTHPVNWRAIRMYTEFGFTPWITNNQPEEVEAWQALSDKLGIPLL